MHRFRVLQYTKTFLMLISQKWNWSYGYSILSKNRTYCAEYSTHHLITCKSVGKRLFNVNVTTTSNLARTSQTPTLTGATIWDNTA